VRLLGRAGPPLLAAALVLAACTGDEIADFGPGAPSADAPELPADAGLDVNDVAADAGTVPAEDADLAEAAWPEAAAWIARENDAGRPVVVNFFAEFCEPCKRELPLLLETAAAEEDVRFLGVHTNEQLALGEQMVDEYGIDFPTFHDPSGDLIFEVGGRGLPHTVAFDTDGRLVSRVFGELTETSLSQLLDEVR
jgi:cytochrome c biogenesis protein CcmG, thiol:disulfide interchange protein DsbE